MNRLHDVWLSFCALPGWVRIWVGAILVPVNLVSFWMLDTATGRAGALAMGIVILFNLPVLFWERGMSKLLSLPHLLAWVPLCLWLLLQLQSGAPMSASETAFAWTLLVVNLVSLGFDTVDSMKWVRGDRAVAGRQVAPGKLIPAEVVPGDRV